MRLIDADALSKDLEKRWNVNDDQDFCNKEVWHALEEAPTIEPDGDLISRQSALAEFRDGRDVYDIMESIEELPSAQPDGDLISRQDAVNEIHKYFVEEIDKTPTEIDEDGDELYADMPTVNSLLACNKELSKRIKSLPSAPDSRQCGEWITTAADSHIFTDKFQENIRENIFGGTDIRGGEDE